ncbi:hypothetical protein BKA69DRAFT_1056580 [Paraphysoderma sedebokerense]|nr:hypothetical protein BKA69DRAFT_1056580 [Paraphysoderma sedebokerense]
MDEPASSLVSCQCSESKEKEQLHCHLHDHNTDDTEGQCDIKNSNQTADCIWGWDVIR